MKKQTFLILFLIVFAFTGIVTFLERATMYIGKDPLESGVVQDLQESYIEYLYNTEVIRQTKEELLASSPVTDEEIDAYRTYFGTMQEQIDSIKEQYTDATEEEIKIRNQKIDDIRANFENDEVAREKVSTLKEVAIENYLREKAEAVSGGEKAHHFNYQIEIEGEDIKEKFESSKPIAEFTRSYQRSIETVTLDPVDYMNNSISLPFVVQLHYPAAHIKVELLKSIQSDSNYGDEIENFEWRKIAFYFFWLLTVVTIVYLVINRQAVKEAFEEIMTYKLPKMTRFIDVNVAVVTIGLWFSIIIANGMSHFVETIVYNLYYGNSITAIFSRTIQFGLLAFSLVVTLMVGAKLVKQLRIQKFTADQFMLTKFVHYVKEVFYNRSIGTQMVIALFVFTCAGFGIGVVMMQPIAILLYIPLFIIIVIPSLFIFVRRFAYLTRIIKHTEKLAAGDIVEPVRAKGNSVLSQHARHINALQNGVKESVQAQAKSERLKTELITNVSHDLRTPLTSIITYTDLLKSEQLTDEERQKYVAVLETKSHRLKQLIEDLFEVSKMASGNIEIQRQQIDVAQLLQQIVAEHEEDYEQAGLALRMTIAEQPMLASADAQKLWRVYDNLMINARKYSLSNTRVYVSLQQNVGNIIFTIKNVTKYELGENVAELTERFKRGDASRNTDGSGLGLAIAQSIVELHGGRLDIELSGDLFQVTVVIPK